MSYWDSEKGVTVHFPLGRMEGSPGWFWLDCGCCGGIEWGGDSPVECRRCMGAGTLGLHLPSKRLALYPGGPFCGVPTDGEVEAAKRLNTKTENGQEHDG